MIATPIANARMYGVAPGAVAAWRALFAGVSARTGVALEIIDHPFPAPLDALWTRKDLGCTFICGWPFIRGVGDLVPVAAPVMADPHAAGRPVYWSDVVVRRDDAAMRLEDLRGRRVAYTVRDSQSGFNALRHFLRGVPGGKPLFGSEIGPVHTPRKAIEAVVAGETDAAPIDSFAHALLRIHVPELASLVRVVARTEPTPAPLLAASAGLDEARLQALRAGFLSLAEDATMQPILASLALLRFVEPLPAADYMTMEHHARAAEAAGIHRLEIADPVSIGP